MLDYGTEWIDTALLRAAKAADIGNFPIAEDIRCGIVAYLETKCRLSLLPLEDLFARVRTMLETVGCAHIARELKPLAPPVTISLALAAMEAGNGFELAFFETLRNELAELRRAGAEEIRFTGLKETAMILRGSHKWNRQCEAMLGEIETFLHAWETEPAPQAAAKCA